jgi:hypothetical protein
LLHLGFTPTMSATQTNPNPKELAEQFLRELAERGEGFKFCQRTQTLTFKKGAEENRVHLWKIDLMVSKFVKERTAFCSVSISHVIEHVLVMIR